MYSVEKNVQILISLMKQHHIKNIVVSPGTTNVALVGSIQNDSYFKLYSSADERSAAYIACGLATELNEPVALSCTGATASRNYIPALTEAFYRNIPILAITSTPHIGRIAQNIPQMVDRSQQLNDMVKYSVSLPIVHTDEDEWDCNVKVNSALLELQHKGSGPVHINLVTECRLDFDVLSLPTARKIERFSISGCLPEITSKRIAVFVGAHKKWSNELTFEVDRFCEDYNAVVICDHTSNYQGKYGVCLNLVNGQDHYNTPCRHIDLLIHIGDVSGSYLPIFPNEVWRVNEDGAIRDTMKKLKYVFEMSEAEFFTSYQKEPPVENLNLEGDKVGLYSEFHDEYLKVFNQIEELPFSNIWIAKQLAKKLPENSVIHLGILNSLRAWNFFEKTPSVLAYSNTGGFGIDGGLSTLVGASLANPDKLYFGVIGDLAFFYDMNALGNRHIHNNLRILLVNNGKGTEFRNYNHNASMFGDEADNYIAAARHYGNQSRALIKHYAEDLGFIYISASSKSEFLENEELFINKNLTDSSIIFEVFTNSQDESQALYCINNTITEGVPNFGKRVVGKILGQKGIDKVKQMLGKE